MPRRSSCTPIARPLKPLPTTTTWKPSGSCGLLARPVGDEGELLERREVAAGLELEVAHLLGGGHVHERAQLVLGRLGRHPGAGVLLEPGRGLADQELAALVVEVARAVGSAASSGSCVCW